VIRALAGGLAIVGAASLLLVPSSAFAARGFTLGVAAGEVHSTSATLWAKADGSGRYTLEVSRNQRFKGILTSRARAKPGNDDTVQATIRGLRPGRGYRYRFVGRGAVSDVGRFRTAPRRSANAKIRFAWTGDTDFTPAPGQIAPYWNDGTIFRLMRRERNDFNIHLGDAIYSDSEVPGALQPIALTVAQKWAKYRLNLGNAFLRALRGSTGFYSHWDDHEFVNDFSPAESTFSNDVNIDGGLLYRNGEKAFRDYAPVRWTKRDGLYRTVRWGRNLQLFFLDQRSFRSAKADEAGVCNNPMTGQPDLAPTAPQATRQLFSVVVPSFTVPVSQACLDAIRDPDRTFLGRRQLARFLRDVKRSKARFKVVVNELPIEQFYALPYDRWEGYEADRQRVLRGLRRVRNVVFLTTDVHATLVNEARFRTLEPGGPRNSGITDITVGPAATANFGLEIDTATGVADAGSLVDSAFFTPAPPSGVGMRCSIVNQFSYGEVEVTSRRLTVTPKGFDGRLQHDGDKPCGPFLFRYRR
jgi:phosphodiesterase/alkaline phosphatase D-like protein